MAPESSVDPHGSAGHGLRSWLERFPALVPTVGTVGFLGLFQAAYLAWRFETMATWEMAWGLGRVAIFVALGTVICLSPLVFGLRRLHPAWRRGDRLRADWSVRFALTAAVAGFVVAETWVAGPLVPPEHELWTALVMAILFGAAAGWVQPSRGFLKAGAVFGLVILGAALLPFGGRAKRPEPEDRKLRPAEGRPDVVLVTIDTLRADRLGVYGHEPSITPEMDRLAGEGVLFKRTLAASPWTLPSVAAILTGLPSARHGAGFPLSAAATYLRSPIDESHETLAERFADAGYRTRAVVANAFLSPELGMAQGFDEYLNPLTDSVGAGMFLELPLSRLVLSFTSPEIWGDFRAEGITNQALEWLDDSEKAPLFLWVHYIDPHSPYQDDPGRLELISVSDFMAPQPEAQDDGTIVGQTFFAIHQVRSGIWWLGEEDRSRIADYYDRGVMYVDRHVGRLFAALRERAAERPVVAALTADHGEEFWDHGHFEHGHDYYREVTRVPLIFWSPGRVPAGSAVDELAGLVDVGATLTELAGLPVTDAAAPDEGRSLVASWNGEAEKFRPLPRFAGGNLYDLPAVLVEEGQWRYILRANETEELYDVTEDPEERFNLADHHPEVAAHFRALLKPRLDTFLKAEAGDGTELSPETLKALQSLGYVQ